MNLSNTHWCRRTFRQSGTHPDGVTLRQATGWTPRSHGRRLAWHSTCPDTMAPSHLHIHGPTSMGLVLLSTKWKRRYERNTPACRHSLTFHFVPITVETLVSLGGEDTDNLIHELGRRIKIVTGELATKFLPQRLSVAIQQRSQCNGHCGLADKQ